MEEWNPYEKFEEKIRRGGEKTRGAIKKGVKIAKTTAKQTGKFFDTLGKETEKLGKEFEKQGRKFADNKKEKDYFRIRI